MAEPAAGGEEEALGPHGHSGGISEVLVLIQVLGAARAAGLLCLSLSSQVLDSGQSTTAASFQIYDESAAARPAG